MPKKPVIVLDPEVGEQAYTGPTGPRIRCPLCEWMPTPHDLWGCNCGHHWHTFDTGGVCPACMHQWTQTHCPQCDAWSAHSDWYEY